MRGYGVCGMSLATLGVGLAVPAFVTGCQAIGGNTQVPPEQSKRFEVMRAKGTHASLRIRAEIT